MKYNKLLAGDYIITCKKTCSILKGSLPDTDVFSLQESNSIYLSYRKKKKKPQSHSISVTEHFFLTIRVYRYIQGQFSREAASLCPFRKREHFLGSLQEEKE